MKPLVVGLGGERPELPARRPVAVVDVAPTPPLVVPSGVSTPGGQAAAASPAPGLIPRAPTPSAQPRPAVPSSPAAPVDEELVPGIKRRLAAMREAWADPGQRTVAITAAVLVALLVYSYFPALNMAYVAWANPQYAHGWIVPLFSVAMLFWWWRPATLPVATSARIVGLVLLVGGFALRLLAARYRIVTIDMYTFVPAVLAVCLMAGGWSVIRWAWAPILFLIFMFPLPDEATRYLLGPLQTLATSMSTFALQTLGVEAYREGNQIVLGDMKLGVVDACSGLRMLTIFCALAVGLVMVGRRTWWENGVILASAIPIALIVNAIRITVTGVLFQVADSEFAERVFHDWAGLVMMPMAIGMLFLEQFILGQLFLPETDARAVLVRSDGAAPAAPSPSRGSFFRRGESASPGTLPGLGLPRSSSGDRGRGGPDLPIVGFPPRDR